MWAARLREDGYEVVSPAEIQEAESWELCLRADLREMCTCDAIALMPGWEGSKGANLELHVAHRIGMRVIHLPLRFDLVTHLSRQITVSERTFGPGERTAIVEALDAHEAITDASSPLQMYEALDVVRRSVMKNMRKAA